MIDLLSHWLHPNVALSIVVAMNINMLALAGRTSYSSYKKNGMNVDTSLVCAIAFIMGSYDPSHENVVNFFNMGDNRFVFSTICISAIGLIKGYEWFRHTARSARGY